RAAPPPFPYTPLFRSGPLLDAEQPLAEARRLDLPRELLLREVAQPPFEAGQPISQPGRLPGTRDVVLAGVDHAPLDPGEALAQRDRKSTRLNSSHVSN